MASFMCKLKLPKSEGLKTYNLSVLSPSNLLRQVKRKIEMSDQKELQKPLPSPRYSLTRYDSGVLLSWFFRVEKLTDVRYEHYTNCLAEGQSALEAYIDFCVADDLLQNLSIVLSYRGEL